MSSERLPDKTLLDRIGKLEKSLKELKHGTVEFMRTGDEFDLDVASDGLDSVEFDALELLKLVFIHNAIQTDRINTRAERAKG